MTDQTAPHKIIAQHGEKIASLEAGYQQVHRDVTSLTGKFDSFNTSIMGKFDNLTQSRKPQFGVWAAWASVVVMAVALIATPFVADLKAMEQEMKQLKNIQIEQAYNNGVRDERDRITLKALGMN